MTTAEARPGGPGSAYAARQNSMPKRSDAKEKMIASAMKLQRMHGVSGTAFADVIRESGAPRGSIYYHFPGGRSELSAAATDYGVEWISGHLSELLESGDVLAAFDGFIEMWKAIVRDEDFFAGCAVAAGALDPERESSSREAAANGFRRWEDQLAAALEGAGWAGEDARSLAVLLITSVEGALILVRAEGDMRPLDLTAARLRAILVAELPAD